MLLNQMSRQSHCRTKAVPTCNTFIQNLTQESLVEKSSADSVNTTFIHNSNGNHKRSYEQTVTLVRFAFYQYDDCNYSKIEIANSHQQQLNDLLHVAFRILKDMEVFVTRSLKPRELPTASLQRLLSLHMFLR